jgi:hypothetical protein
MKTSKPGRPKLPKGEAKSLMVRARITPDEFKTLSNAAKQTGQGLSEWARKVLISEAIKQP